jgi:uncharacterized membrane protein
MVKVHKCMLMATNIKVNLLTDFLKVMVSMYGLMDQYLKEILNRDQEMDMVYGKVLKELARYIKDIICSIKSMVTEYMIGETVMSIKDFGLMIFVMAKVNYSLTTKCNIMDIGRMDNKLIISLT